MSEPIWLTVEDVIAIHGEQLAVFGGPLGIRDQGLLESALARPINRWNYGVSDVADLAAAYAFGVSHNHPFVDGNKRAAFAAMMVFLRLNGHAFAPDVDEATAMMLDLAAGDIDEDGLTRWIRDVLEGRRPRLTR
jgi:death-on-curing protein